MKGQLGQVESNLAKVLAKKDLNFATRNELSAVNKTLDGKIKDAQRLGAVDTQLQLEQLKREIGDLTKGRNTVEANALLAEAMEIHPDVGDFVAKFTSRYGNPVFGPEAFKEVAKILSEKMGEFVPVSETYIDWLKRLGQTYARETGKTVLPWITYDKKNFKQDYRPKVQQEIRFYDPKSRRYIRNVYQMDTPDGKVYGKADIGDTRRGYGVNGNHALDSSLLRIFYDQMEKKGIPATSVHDAVFLNLNDVPKAVDALRETYAIAREANNLQWTMDALRKAGLSQDAYDRFLKEGRELGFFDDGFSADEIRATKRPPPGYDWYAWGP